VYKPLIVVSAIALINDQNQVLYAQRPKGKNMEGLWEFPGGKLEPGETAETAIQRELMEELSLHVELDDLIPLTFASQEYDDFIMIMPLFICKKWSGSIHPNEGQSYAWVNLEDLKSYPMPPADAPLLDHILKFMKAALSSTQ
jgi:8-oxo-dGTP diphosphatase